MQNFLVTSHFTFTVKSIMALKVIFTTLKKNVSIIKVDSRVIPSRCYLKTGSSELPRLSDAQLAHEGVAAPVHVVLEIIQS